jgi:uncharacterized membrane protein
MPMTRDAGEPRSRPTTPGRSGLTLMAAIAVALLPHTAAAYVGPGAGLSMLAALWAVIAAILFALAGLVIWPIRAMRRRRRALATAKAGTPSGDGGGGA